jgi:hypothetical protein
VTLCQGPADDDLCQGQTQLKGVFTMRDPYRYVVFAPYTYATKYLEFKTFFKHAHIRTFARCTTCITYAGTHIRIHTIGLSTSLRRSTSKWMRLPPLTSESSLSSITCRDFWIFDNRACVLAEDKTPSTCTIWQLPVVESLYDHMFSNLHRYPSCINTAVRWNEDGENWVIKKKWHSWPYVLCTR